jgi:branched-chain amino acid transport system ATP-binding protein
MLEVRALRKSFGGFAALDGVDLDVGEGTIHAVIGPNGAGKTTLFNLITGVLPPTSGRIVFEGTEITRRRPDSITRLGLARTFQNIRIFREMSARENVLVGTHCRTSGGFLEAVVRIPGRESRKERAARERAEALLDLVGLGAKQRVPAEELSLVEQRRLELARALASDPRLLLLDEPAAGMTAPEIEELGRLIQKIADGGMTILLTEHHMRLVMRVSHAVTVLSYGRKIAEGRPDVVRRHPDVLEAYLGRDN